MEINKKIGFIGSGNMAQAIIKGLLSKNIIKPENIIASDPDEKKLQKLCEEKRIKTTKNNLEVIENAEIIILAIKPNVFKQVLQEIKGLIREDQILVSIAAGISIDFIKNHIKNEKIKIVRVMPNMPALVGEGMSAICCNQNLSEEELIYIKDIFDSIGKSEFIDEKYMDSVTAISGSSPAYVYLFIEALADGGVLLGLPRDIAYRLASQAVLGAAKMVLETNMHPGVLKDFVCSPGGTTIEAIKVFEKNGFRGIVMDAMVACYEKAKKLSN